MADEEDFLIRDAKRFAELDERYSSTLFSFYSIDEKMVGAVVTIQSALKQKEQSWHPWGLMIGRGTFGKISRNEVKLLSGPPTLKIFLDQQPIELPQTDYLVMSSPCIVSDSYTDRFAPRQTIDIVLGLLRAACGRSITLAHFGDQVIVPAITQQSTQGEVFRVPHRDDTINFTDPKVLSEVFFKLATMDKNHRAPILYALTMFGRASEEMNLTFRFALSWIALEMIGQTQGDGVAAKLANAYGVNKHYVYNDLEFRCAYNYRHALFHRGIVRDLDARLERMMQCYFLDLLRARLHLSCMKLAASAKAAMGELVDPTSTSCGAP